jgi:cytochrome c oxidase subunit IV
MKAQPISGEVLSPRIYFLVFLTLLALAVVTTLVSFLDLGPFHAVVSLAIAAIKATLVALFFMGVIHSPHLVRLTVAGGVLWLAIMILLTLGDYLTRGWVPFPGK